MAVPGAITELSETPASNPPAGSENASTTDDYIRTAFAFIAELYADKAALASPALVTPTADGIAVGWKSIPSIASTGETIAVAGKGKLYKATGNMTVPNSTFAADDAVSFYNNSASAITIIQGSGVTMRLAGTTTTGTRTLAPRGLATAWFVSASEVVVGGAGVT